MFWRRTAKAVPFGRASSNPGNQKKQNSERSLTEICSSASNPLVESMIIPMIMKLNLDFQRSGLIILMENSPLWKELSLHLKLISKKLTTPKMLISLSAAISRRLPTYRFILEMRPLRTRRYSLGKAICQHLRSRHRPLKSK